MELLPFLSQWFFNSSFRKIYTGHVDRTVGKFRVATSAKETADREREVQLSPPISNAPST